MSAELQARLVELQNDYVSRTGKPFRHFFCPILWKDEGVDLCMGHVINKSFEDSWRGRVPQRKDVDSFCGAAFECEFQTLVSVKSRGIDDILSNDALMKKAKPKLFVDGEPWRYYCKSASPPSQHTALQLELNNGSSVGLTLAKTPEEVLAAESKKWEWIVEGNYIPPTIASLIKAAHLTLFHLLGYGYGLSAASYFVGYMLLGQFFRENCRKPIQTVRAAASSYFLEYANMVRPMASVDPKLRGTAEDGMAIRFLGSSGAPFALGVLIRVGAGMHTVLVPAFDRADAVPVFLDFLKNDTCQVLMSPCRYDRKERVWYFVRDIEHYVTWPKDSL